MLSKDSGRNGLPAGQQTIDMAARQKPLRASYGADPAKAWITDRARTSSKNVAPGMPLYGEVTFEGGRPITMTYGVHKAIGGEGDYPVPGEILCGAVAACLDSSIRIVANQLGITLDALHVDVEACVDVRGTLIVDKSVPVAFQTFDIKVHLDTADQVQPQRIEILLKTAEHCCVVLQTLRASPTISLTSSRQA